MTTLPSHNQTVCHDFLNLNQTGEELKHVWDNDYYWYFSSPEFRDAFFKPMAVILNRLCYPRSLVLDVACGEGVLVDYLNVPYIGLEASVLACNLAQKRKPGIAVLQGRLENPSEALVGIVEAVVFSGVLEVLVKADKRVELLEHYRQTFSPRYFLICDLERLDTSAIEKRYTLLEQYHRISQVPTRNGLPLEHADVKCRRKILLFSTRPRGTNTNTAANTRTTEQGQ